jgi:predicted ATP-dependent Lon-type protease
MKKLVNVFSLAEAVEGRDEKGIKKTVCAFLKILHPTEFPLMKNLKNM